MLKVLLISLGTLAVFLAAFYSSNPWVVLPCGGAMILVLLACIVVARRDPNLPLAVRRKIWMVLLPIFGLLLKIALVLNLIQLPVPTTGQ